MGLAAPRKYVNSLASLEIEVRAEWLHKQPTQLTDMRYIGKPKSPMIQTTRIGRGQQVVTGIEFLAPKDGPLAVS